MRPDEAARLEYRDVAVVDDADSGERILEIAARGKRGVGYGPFKPVEWGTEIDLKEAERMMAERTSNAS
ncbi:hypothetical protein [Brevundimonas sp.]|uniref:hypothetical protein n=1 Tax=Brevundimonas sp. TaxID=1871086 RepID=UPI002D58B400|nr:hypothetical protein [Brevundimonas sp.]HYC97706.1 hypothetical protein [Brevundimonas sp.]